MKTYLVLFLMFVINNSFGQNYNVHLDIYSYLSCDELETEIVKRTNFKYGWDDYELNSEYLETIKIYKSDKFYTTGYFFALVKFKKKEGFYVYCGVSESFKRFYDLGNDNVSDLFIKYISPYKCDCK